MANKATKQAKADFAKARRQGVTALEFPVPAFNFHSTGNMTVRVRHLSFMGKDGVVSTSPARNMQERVLCNAGGGTNSCLTVHEPIDPKSPIVHKNHGYRKFPEYKQPLAVRGRAS